MNARRIRAIYKRHLFETARTPAELFDLLYWASFDLLAWGLLTSFLRRDGVNLPVPVAYLVGAAMLWNVLYRLQLHISVSFLKESWASNMISLLASPITPGEYLTAAATWAATLVTVAVSIMGLLAYALFSFGILKLGLALIPFIAVLMLFAVAMSLFVLGIVIRVGDGANVIAWGLAGVMQPLSAVFFPLNILPAWAQAVARALPPSHVFEGMRRVLAGGGLDVRDIAIAAALDVLYILAGGAFAARMFTSLRRRGLVTRYAT